MKNTVFKDINIGDSKTYTRTITQQDIEKFADVSGDRNPLHLSEDFARTTQFGGTIAHGALSLSFISKILGMDFPGPGTTFLGMDKIRFLAPVRPGDTVEARVTVTKKHESKPIVTFNCEVFTQDGTKVLEGVAVVKAPEKNMEFPRHDRKAGP